VHGRHQGLIVQHTIDVTHPRFLKIADGFGNERIPEMPLATARVSHRAISDDSPTREVDATVAARPRGSVRRSQTRPPKTWPTPHARSARPRRIRAARRAIGSHRPPDR